MLELVVGALIGTAAGTGITVWVCRHTLATITERRDLAAVDLAQAEVEGATAARTAAATEQVMQGIARDLDVIRWHGADQARVHAEQHDYYRRLLGWHEYLRETEARLTPAAPVLSVADLRTQFAAVTGGGTFEDLPVLGASSVWDRLGGSVVAYAPADPDLLGEPEPAHHPSEAWTAALQELVDTAEHGPVQHDALVSALLSATGEQPEVDTPDEPVEDPADEPHRPAPTVPEPKRVTGRTRAWMGPARRLPVVPSPLVIGRSVRELMRLAEEQRIDALVRDAEIPVLVGAGA